MRMDVQLHCVNNNSAHERESLKTPEYETQKQQTNHRSELELQKIMICVDGEKTGTRTKAEPPLLPNPTLTSLKMLPTL